MNKKTIRTPDDEWHDTQVAGVFVNSNLYKQWRVTNYSLFAKKPVNNIRFEVGALYIGTRICHADELELEESVVLYIEDRTVNQNGEEIITALTVYYEILQRDENTHAIKKCLQDIKDGNPNLYSHFYLTTKIDGVETILYNRLYPDYDLEVKDLAGITISAKTKAELKGWWIKENYSTPDNDDEDFMF